jgi:hypothetical protein
VRAPSIRYPVSVSPALSTQSAPKTHSVKCNALIPSVLTDQ